MGGIYITSNQQMGTLLQKHRDTNGSCIALLSKVLGGGGGDGILLLYHATTSETDRMSSKRQVQDIGISCVLVWKVLAQKLLFFVPAWVLFVVSSGA